VRRELAAKEDWTFLGSPGADEKTTKPPEIPVNILLPIMVLRGDKFHLFENLSKLKKQDVVTFLILKEERSQGIDWLHSHGWKHIDIVKPGEPSKAN
jgi:hypothetical protein